MVRVCCGAGTLAFLFLSGCGYTFRALEEHPHNAGAVTAAETFHLEPLAFAFEPPADWEDQNKWAEHVSAWSLAFEETVRTSFEDEVPGKQLQVLKPGAKVSQGVVIKVSVVDVIRNWNAWSGGHDQVIADVVVYDAGNGSKLYTGKADATSKRFGPEGWSFGGRIKFACQNLADAAVSVMRVAAIRE